MAARLFTCFQWLGYFNAFVPSPCSQDDTSSIWWYSRTCNGGTPVDICSHHRHID
jgi:hypothetical protein